MDWSSTKVISRAPVHIRESLLFMDGESMELEKILLIDAEKWVRTDLKRKINNLNLPLKVIHECQNGLEALGWLKHNDVDLVITDIKMHITDGITFLNELRKMKKGQDVVAISVHDEFKFVRLAFRSGITDYLLKPIGADELRDSLEKWLYGRQEEGSVLSRDLDGNLKTSCSTIEEVLDYIKKTPLNNVSLQSAADKVNVNASYLSQLFKLKLNKKFINYITELRINESKRLLLSTTLRMSEIIEQVGYSNLTYFSNHFKKNTGYSPSEFRKNMAEKNNEFK